MTTTPRPPLDEATLWLASTADVAREDGKPALAEIAERVLDELIRLRVVEQRASLVAEGRPARPDRHVALALSVTGGPSPWQSAVTARYILGES